ncbi:MAG TPA: 2OG-Fe(II) oxygenase [Burkholderiales bacterium]|nr:2OG-Fe(II) oxygenase [Burkholderiales bacterium]
MAMLVNFSPEIRTWILHNLDRGCAPSALVGSMVDQKFEPQVAQGLIDAFVHARSTGAAPPGDSVTLELPPLEYRYETPCLAPGNTIRASDRVISVLARTEEPILAVLEGVLSAEECDELIELSRPRLKASTVVDPETGENTIAEYRDSDGMFFRLEETPFIAKLDRRISGIMSCPIENGEGLQVLRYGPGAKTTPHFDFLVPSNPANKASLARSGQRISTLIVYLNDVISGGETVFPEVGLSVSAKKGNAVYFEYANTLNQVDYRSLHAGAPVAEGEKWAVTKWMRERRFLSA